MQLPIDFVSARRTDPETSQANRDAFTKKITQRDLILLTYYRYHDLNVVPFMYGMTDEEVGKFTKLGTETMFDLRACYWKRCSELRKQGFIESTNETRVSSAGSHQQVCRITQEGINYVEQTILK
jgi:hypothetical protein